MMQVQIERIELENYKQFVGRNPIDFSTDSKRNITLIRGTNGSGKTNLVGAMAWCLDGPEPATPRWLKEGSLPISWQKMGKAAQHEKISNVRGKVLVKHGRKKLSVNRVAVYRHLENQVILNKTSANVSTLNPYKTLRGSSLEVNAYHSTISQCAMMCHFFMEWHEHDFQLTKSRNYLRTAALQLIPARDLVQQLPLIARESTKMFRAIVGKHSSYFSSTVEITPDCRLKLLKSGQNIVCSLPFSELTALSFALLLSVVSISGKGFPIVLDSPFARLSKCKDNFARVLGTLKQQVIILAHDAELFGVTALSRRIGREYVIKMDNKNGTSRILPKEIITCESSQASRKTGRMQKTMKGFRV